MEIFKNTALIRWVKLQKFIEEHGDVVVSKVEKGYIVYPRGFYHKAIKL